MMSAKVMNAEIIKRVELEVDETLAQWVGHMANKSLSGMRDIYVPNALLDPTLSPVLLRTAEEREAYFIKIFQTEGLWCDITSRVIEVGSADFATAEGRYHVHYREDGDSKTFKAKFMMSFYRYNGKLRICGHTAGAVMEEDEVKDTF